MGLAVHTLETEGNSQSGSGRPNEKLFNTYRWRIDHEIRKKYREIKSLCVIISQKPPFRDPTEGLFSDDAKDRMELLQAAFNGDRSRACSEMQERVSPAQTVYCLIGISIMEWIFKPDPD